MPLQARDDMGRDLLLGRPPRRIVSLVPSDTWSLFALGVGARVVGRTTYCVEPAADVAAIPTVGGTKDVDVEAIVALAPDLVIANQEENARPALEALAARGIPLFVGFPRRVADGLGLLARYARLLGIEAEPTARALIRRAYAAGAAAPPPADAPRAFVPIWDDPLMTFCDDTYAADLLARVGVVNAFGDRERRYPLAADLGRRSPVAADRADRDRRYPRVTRDEVVARAPDLILLPDEPHAYGTADVARFAAIAPTRLVSGKDLFWHGAWTLDALDRLPAALAGRPDAA
jgi:ABC-type Fe3+-hydroxamate transport system substrate-binding protein